MCTYLFNDIYLCRHLGGNRARLRHVPTRGPRADRAWLPHSPPALPYTLLSLEGPCAVTPPQESRSRLPPSVPRSLRIEKRITNERRDKEDERERGSCCRAWRWEKDKGMRDGLCVGFSFRWCFYPGLKACIPHLLLDAKPLVLVGIKGSVHSHFSSIIHSRLKLWTKGQFSTRDKKGKGLFLSFWQSNIILSLVLAI